jgi:hypothetical protein
MAQHTDDGFLLYLIDIAIIEANAKARSSKKSSLKSVYPPPLERDDPRSAHKRAPELHIVH